MDPGLVYDLNITDYLNYLCGRGYNSSQLKIFNHKPYTCPESFSLADFNYPTITIPEFGPGHSVNVSRIVTNVGPKARINCASKGHHKLKFRLSLGNWGSRKRVKKRSSEWHWPWRRKLKAPLISYSDGWRGLIRSTMLGVPLQLT